MSLETRTSKLNIVINFGRYDVDIEKVFKLFQVWCHKYCDTYSMIIHNQDLNPNKSLVFPHIHCVAIYFTSRRRIGTIINLMSQELGISESVISIKKIIDYNSAIKYLIHKDEMDTNKYLYNINDIVSNINPLELECIINSNETSVDFSTLVSICRDSNFSRVYIIDKVGLSFYRLNWRAIDDILNEIKKGII